jgi:hypothetical protein
LDFEDASGSCNGTAAINTWTPPETGGLSGFMIPCRH